LNYGEQFCLNIQRDFAYLIQKNGAAVCQFKLTGLSLLSCPGEGTFFIAEQLGFKQGFGNTGAVDRNKGHFLSVAFIMQCFCNQTFTGTGFPMDKYSGRAVCNPNYLLFKLLDFRTGSDDIVNGKADILIEGACFFGKSRFGLFGIFRFNNGGNQLSTCIKNGKGFNLNLCILL